MIDNGNGSPHGYWFSAKNKHAMFGPIAPFFRLLSYQKVKNTMLGLISPNFFCQGCEEFDFPWFYPGSDRARGA